MGVDVGTKLHVVIRRRLGETGDGSRALFVGELTDFSELATLGQRFNVQRCVIDAQPEGRAAAEFARNQRDMIVDLTNYSRRELGTDTNMNGGVRFLSLNRAETMDAPQCTPARRTSERRLRRLLPPGDGAQTPA